MSLPPNFVRKLNEGKVIPFVGAGVSMNVCDKDGNKLFPKWIDLLLAFAKKLKDNGKEAGVKLVEGNLEKEPPDYLEAAKQAQNFLGSEFYDLVKEKISVKFGNVDEKSLIIPKTIWEFSNNLIITTNYDKVLFWSCPNKNDLNLWNIQAPKEQADLIKSQVVSQPTVWHLHGHIDDVRNIILTPDGYERLYPADTNSETTYEAAIATLKSLLISHTFLFIGFSLEDEYFVNQLKYVQKLFQGTSDKHYILILESEKARLSSLGIEIEPITFESFGEKMLEKLFEIRDQFSPVKNKETLTATERFNPKNRVVHIPFNQKGDQVVGREDDLRQVHETLSKGFATNIGQAVSIQGLGGLGKTQLAVEYAYKFQDEYPNGVMWLTVDQDIDKQLVEICDKAEWVAPQSEIKVKLEVARHRLKTVTDCLIVLDNVETFDERIKNYLPPSRNDIHILATSRYEIIGFNPIPLKLLTTEQAVQMLKQESRREIEEGEAKTVEQIAEELGNLPLALELAGGFLRYRNIGWENYLALLRQNPREAFKGKFLQGSFTYHDTDVYRTLKVSETLFETEPLLRDILDLLTWSGTSPMGIDLMSKLLGKSETELLLALTLGDSLNLLTKSPERNAYAIHRLVAEVRKEDIPLPERLDWINSICELLGDWFQDIKDDFNSRHDYEAELHHLIIWQKHSSEFATENASRLLWLQSYPVYFRGKYNEAKEIISKSLTLYEKTNCKNLEVLAHLYIDFGSLLSELDEHKKSLEYTEKALKIRLQILGEKNEETISAFLRVGESYSGLKQNHKYQNFTEKALQLSLTELGEEHLHTTTSYNNLGIFWGKLKIYKKELEYTQKSLDIRLKLYKENHPAIAFSYNNLSVTYMNLKNFQKGLEYAQKALNIYLKIFGEKHPETAYSFSHIGSAYKELGKFTIATEFLEKALQVSQEVFGNNHSFTVDSVIQLTTLYIEHKKNDGALRLVSEFLRLVPKSNSNHKRLESQKRWILRETQKPGFRQQSVNPAKKKGKKKRR